MSEGRFELDRVPRDRPTTKSGSCLGLVYPKCGHHGVSVAASAMVCIARGSLVEAKQNPREDVAVGGPPFQGAA